jgi:hypothetical protein
MLHRCGGYISFHPRNRAEAMDPRIVKQVRATRTAPAEEFVEGLVRAIAEVAGGALNVRKAKDGLGAVLQSARNGVPQIIGTPKDPVVAISVGDLAALLKAVREPTLGDVLAASGLKRYHGQRIVISQGHKREPLKRTRGDTSDPAS